MPLIIFHVLHLVVSLSCLDSSGSPKDYFLMLKAPASAMVPPLPGKSYMYLDPTHPLGFWMPEPLNISSPLTYTLDQFNKDSNISYIVYK